MSNETSEQVTESNSKLLKAKQLEVNSLLEVTQAINSNLSADHLFKIFEFISRGQIGVEQMAIIYYENKRWSCVSQYGTIAYIFDKRVFKELTRYTAITSLTGHKDEILNQYEYVIPIQHQQKAIAFVLVGKFRDTSYAGSAEDKVKFLQTLSNIIIVAIQNKKLFERQLEQEAIKKELEVAAQMQKMLIPSIFPPSKDLEIDAVYIPHHSIGGDYYDLISLEDGSYVVCIADISGKGIPAALLMSNFQANLRLLVQQDYSLKEAVTLLNNRVSDVARGDKFITLFLGKYDPKSKKLIYINAGHNPPLLYQEKEKQVILLDKGSTLLGIFDQLPSITTTEITISPNSFLFKYTDGVTELENETNEQYELERLTNFMIKNKSLSMKEFNHKMLNELTKYKGKRAFNDDVTFLSARFL